MQNYRAKFRILVPFLPQTLVHFCLYTNKLLHALKQLYKVSGLVALMHVGSTHTFLLSSLSIYIFLSLFSAALSCVCSNAVIVVSLPFSSPVPSLLSCRHVSNAAGLRWSCMPVSRGGTPHFHLCCLTLYCLCSSNVSFCQVILRC